MREIRLHGRGGQGTVTSAEILVHAAVAENLHASCFPYFGFEKKGGPVSAFVRIDTQKIRQKTQVYNPGCVVVMDPTLVSAVNVFEGMAPESVLVINTKKPISDYPIPPQVRRVGYLDATGLALDLLGRPVPNTVMLGAFVAATGWVDLERVVARAAEIFGPQNATAVREGYARTTVVNLQ